MKAIYEIKKVYKKLSRNSGASLAELAVVTAIMATLATTAGMKLSAVSEKSKAQQTMKEIDKILKMAQKFYNDTDGEFLMPEFGYNANGEIEITSYEYQPNNGKFPGQEKKTMPVGGYGREITPDMNHWEQIQAIDSAYHAMRADLINYTNYTSEIGTKWRSVFGTQHERTMSPGHKFVNDEYNPCWDCTQENSWDWNVKAHGYWLSLFNHNVLESPFQDGHYIFVVIPGTASDIGFEKPPRIIVADAEHPFEFHKMLIP